MPEKDTHRGPAKFLLKLLILPTPHLKSLHALVCKKPAKQRPEEAVSFSNTVTSWIVLQCKDDGVV